MDGFFLDFLVLGGGCLGLGVLGGLLGLDLSALVVGHVGLDLLNGLLDLGHGVDILLDQGGVLLTGLVQAVDQCAELTLRLGQARLLVQKIQLVLALICQILCG